MPLAHRAPVLIAVAVALAGCAVWQPPVPGGWDTYADMRAYYSRHAVEWDGRCRVPYLDGLLESEVVRDTEDELALLTTYYWRDRVGDDAGNHMFPFGGTDRCKGIDERTFVFAKRDDGALEVVGMSGLTRGDPLPAMFQ